MMSPLGTQLPIVAAPMAGGATTVDLVAAGSTGRTLRNDFVDAHEPEAPYGYPVVHHLTRGLRQAAARAGDAERVNLWAGTGFRSAATGPAAEVVRGLAAGL